MDQTVIRMRSDDPAQATNFQHLQLTDVLRLQRTGTFFCSEIWCVSMSLVRAGLSAKPRALQMQQQDKGSHQDGDFQAKKKMLTVGEVVHYVMVRRDSV